MGENQVTLNGRVFDLAEPSLGITLRILNVIGSVGMRAEKAAHAVAVRPTDRTLIFALLSEMGEDDLYNLGSAVLQFQDAKEGRRWLRENGLRLDPIIQAFFINLKLSTDLVDSIKDFFDGANQVSAMIGKITGRAEAERAITETPPTPTASE